MSITFDSQEAFENAVMAVLHGRLSVNVSVSMGDSMDYYSRERVPVVAVELNDAEAGCISSAEDRAY